MFPQWCINEGVEGVETHCRECRFGPEHEKKIKSLCPKPAGVGVKVTNGQSFQRGCFSFIFHSLVRRKVP